MSTQLTLDFQAFSILITTYYAHSPLLPTFFSTYLTHSSVDERTHKQHHNIHHR
jgi:hypothetical protein